MSSNKEEWWAILLSCCYYGFSLLLFSLPIYIIGITHNYYQEKRGKIKVGLIVAALIIAYIYYRYNFQLFSFHCKVQHFAPLLLLLYNV